MASVKEARAAMEEMTAVRRAGELPPVLVINRSQDEPVTGGILSALGESVSSTMSLPLIIEDQVAGALAVIAEGDDLFTADHSRLYATLKEPFFVAMANTITMEQEGVVRLKNLLAEGNRYLNRELLDEIGEMPLDAQVRLLRVLQHREVQRVGGTERIPLDIRVIASTNQDLGQRVRTGHFREDLWFRLNVFPIHVTPLRDRKSDIPALV